MRCNDWDLLRDRRKLNTKRWQWHFSIKYFPQLGRYFPSVPVAGEAVLTRVDGVAGAGVVLPRPQRGAGGLAATSARKQLRREGPAE